MKKLELAFPQMLEYTSSPGMSLRDYFAAKAMEVVLADFCGSQHRAIPEDWNISVALDAYKMADAMLAARSKA